MLRVRLEFTPELNSNPYRPEEFYLLKQSPRGKVNWSNISVDIWSLKLYTQPSSPALLFPSSDLQAAS